MTAEEYTEAAAAEEAAPPEENDIWSIISRTKGKTGAPLSSEVSSHLMAAQAAGRAAMQRSPVQSSAEAKSSRPGRSLGSLCGRRQGQWQVDAD